MEKIKSTINLLKTMLNTSYDTSAIIDKETNKVNKKSSKIWLLGIMAFLLVYFSYKLINELAKLGAEHIFLEMFFLLLQILVLFQAILLGISVIYFSDDIQNYLYLPISNIKLFVTKFAVMMSIIFGTELTIVLPSLYIYGARVIANNVLAYYVLVILVLFLVSIFLATLVIIVMIPVMRIFRFIKNKYWYQTVVVFVMTFIMLAPITNSLLGEKKQVENIQNSEINYSETQEENNKEVEQLNSIRTQIGNINKYYIVGELGVEALTKSDINSFINMLKILGLNIITFTILLCIGRFTYIKDILWSLSLFDKKKNRRINFNKRCKVRNKQISFLSNDIRNILKNSTFFMHYIYNVFMIIGIIVMLAVVIVPVFKQFVIEHKDEIGVYNFNFESFSIILGIIQLLFTIAPMSLTAISRYGKNAMFFKYIPIQQTTQFRLKNIPQILRDTIIIMIVLITIYYLFPEMSVGYIILLFISGMLLNIINSYVLLLIDLQRPQLNNENEVSVLEQNDNKIFKYIVTVVICVILWYLSEATKELSLNMSILIEIIAFSIIFLILEIIISKKKDALFKNIM